MLSNAGLNAGGLFVVFVCHGTLKQTILTAGY